MKSANKLKGHRIFCSSEPKIGTFRSIDEAFRPRKNKENYTREKANEAIRRLSAK